MKEEKWKISKSQKKLVREAMKEYNRTVKAAMEGDLEAQAKLISVPRADSIHIDCKVKPRRQKNGTGLPCKYCEYREQCKNKLVDIPKRWETFEEWVEWNRKHGKPNTIERMMKDV